MKAVSAIAKIVAALAAVAGIVYIVATYGDKIVAWAKKMLNIDCPCACPVEESVEAEVSEAEVSEAAPTEEVPADGDVVASEGDFEG